MPFFSAVRTLMSWMAAAVVLVENEPKEKNTTHTYIQLSS